MGYVMGAVFAGGGIALFRKGGTGKRILGVVLALVGLAFLALSIMVDAKRNGVI